MKKIFPNVNTTTVKDYFKLPKNKREKFGFYLRPHALIYNRGLESEWDIFENKIREQYPVQGFIREQLLDLDKSPLWSVIRPRFYDIKAFYYTMKRYLGPNYLPRFRKSVSPRQYKDICDIIVDGNLALISDFWHNEVRRGIINWDSDEEHRQFFKWLESAIFWIEAERIILLHELETFIKNGSPYYFQDRITEEIKSKDTKVLTEMIKYRDFFWT